MRTFILISFLIITANLSAQNLLPGSFVDNSYRGSLLNNIHVTDSAFKNKWFVSNYAGISTSFSFFKGGNATIVSAPVGLQLNRRLNNNVFAFAGISAAPSYINFNSAFLNSNFNKMNGNGLFQSNSLGIFSRAELGLQYINDKRTFSISGSIGVERSNVPIPLYTTPLNPNTTRLSQARK